MMHFSFKPARQPNDRPKHDQVYSGGKQIEAFGAQRSAIKADVSDPDAVRTMVDQAQQN
jgi:hypothetical protein